jgi:hypothetical protein
MLLSQFKTGAAASALQGVGRDAALLRSGVATTRRVSLGVRASAGAEGAGWLESSSQGIGSRLGGLANSLFGSNKDTTQEKGAGNSGDMVTYKGKAVIMKKLWKLDLIDRGADLADDASELRGKRVIFQLISDDVDTKSNKPILSKEVALEKWVQVEGLASQDITFDLQFSVPKSFGVPHAILVKNQHPNEFLLVSFSLEIPGTCEAHYLTNSWVYNTGDESRIFFYNKAYLPSDTPPALREYREKELQHLRGEGPGDNKNGERTDGERIYDYDTYSDLGKSEEDKELERPNLGGPTSPEYQYPRRVRTGRKLVPGTPYESRKGLATFYIPRDEQFERIKMSDFKADGVRSKGHALTSKVKSAITRQQDFESIDAIRKLFAPKGKDLGGLDNILPDKENVGKQNQFPLVFLEELINPDGSPNAPLQYPLPMILHTDPNAWQTNAQFAREFLAGLNPVVISLVKEFPLKSALPENIYGKATSAITADHIKGQLEGLTPEQAVAQKKLFVADYHDAYLPFVERINMQKNSKTYATRALFFLQPDETLKVLALELVLPPVVPGGAKKSKVVLPPADHTKVDWYWECAKAHVLNNDIVAHQVFSHFSKCHAVTEPHIIATARQLSKLHPINHLMTPHFKATMEINRGARARLIAAGGVIESTFTPRAFSMRMAAANYRDAWQWDTQALPTDLIARGMAEKDPNSKYGIKLLVDDYPYAKDGLDMWFAIKQWNTDYVDIYYADDNAVKNDVELQNWWTEIREKGHEDKKNAPGWPEMNSKANLVDICTTMQWIPSCQHAAINFGQYAYAGFMPHHPTLTRRLLPDDGTKEMDELKKGGEKFYLSLISDISSAVTTMSVYEVLSSHSPNEIYIGDRQINWAECDKVNNAFKKFSAKLEEIDREIEQRNKNSKLKNRLGAAQVPYNLLRPSSQQGVTARGVPNSITI